MPARAELVVVRNVADLVPVCRPDSGTHGVSAALEYAVDVLRIQHIVVLGHAQCGSMARLDRQDRPALSEGDFIGHSMAIFVEPGEVVEQRDHETMQDFVVRIRRTAIFRSLEDLMTFPVRAHPRRAQADRLARRLFGVTEGSLFVLDPEHEGVSQRAGRARPRMGP